jgi:hypothetical protein
MEDAEKRLVFAAVAVIWLAIAFVLIWVARRAATRQAKVALEPGEQRVADIFVETKQITWGGLTLFGSPYDGKLILTTERLIYANANERKTGFVLARDAITAIRKGADGPRMTLELDYMPAKGNKPKHVRFVQIGGIGGMLQYVDASKQMPIGMFIDKLLVWKQVA